MTIVGSARWRNINELTNELTLPTHAGETEFGSIRGVYDSEHNDVGFVEVSKLSAMKDAFFS